MKERILSILRAVSPGLADRAISVRRRLSRRRPVSLNRASRVARLEAEVASLSDRVRELAEEVDEARRDSLRIAELTDIVERRLSSGEGSEQA